MIVIPEAHFRNARLEDILSHLSWESKDRDPRGTGVDFVLVPSKASREAGSATEEADPFGGIDPFAEVAAAGHKVTVSMEMHGSTLYDVLMAVTQVAGAEYRMLDRTVLVYEPENPRPADELEPRPSRPSGSAGIPQRDRAAPASDGRSR